MLIARTIYALVAGVFVGNAYILKLNLISRLVIKVQINRLLSVITVLLRKGMKKNKINRMIKASIRVIIAIVLDHIVESAHSKNIKIHSTKTFVKIVNHRLQSVFAHLV